MVIPFFIFDSNSQGLPGLTPTFTLYKKRDADGNLTDLTPPPILDDGGAGYYVMTDAGVEQEGTLRYAWDKHHWCFCQPALGDGGLVGTNGDGWVRVKDELPCAL